MEKEKEIRIFGLGETKKSYPVIKNGDERLRDYCYKGLEEKYSDDMMFTARTRLDHELDLICKSNQGFIFLHVREVLPVVEKDGKYYLRAGKRRLIAAKKADLKKVSVKVEE